ncbi:MAG: DUF1540 domain-containing protein [Oscillospiraceae bacterium]|nr:DUF1540 domain-containing protein [Oscillospiraceae bacterium]
MDKNYANKSIECSVDNCVNHCASDNYCALQKIIVGAHGKNPSDCQSTDCQSFVEK